MSELLAAAHGVTLDIPLDDGSTVRTLDGVHVSVASGEAVALMGPSGAGKSTLGLVLAGLQAPTSGQVLHARGHEHGPPVASMVLQRAELAFLGDTVREDVGFGLRLAGADEASVDAAVLRSLAAVALDAGVLEEQPLALSGGEQRRVAIAGVIAAAPRLVVLDEPTSGLDAGAREAVRELVRALVRSGTAVVLITHDPEDAALCPRLVVLARGRVAYDGPTDAVLAVPPRAAELGIAVPQAVQLAHAVAGAAGHTSPVTLDEGALLACIVRHAGAARGAGRDELLATPGAPHAAMPETPRAAGPGWLVASLHQQPHRLDARAALVTFALFAAATFLAGSLAAAAVVLAVAGGAVLVARVPARTVATTLRPFVLVLVAIAAVQLAFGGAPEVALVGDRVVASDAAFVARRMAQLLAILLGSLLLTHGADAVALADGLRWLLAPLRLLRLPVEQFALVLAIGLASVPAMASDVRAVELAQAARVGRRGRGSLAARLRLRAGLLVPLLVHALRRSRHLGDALHVRGYRPGMQRTPWQPLPPRASDALPVLGAALLVVLAVTL